MKQKTFKRAISIMLTVFLLICTSSFALTSASAAQSSELTKVTDTVAVVLSSDNIGADSTDHTFTAVKIMDLYKIDDVDATAYQYKLVLDEALATSPDFGTLLSGNGFKYDANTGEITLADGTAIISQKGVNENTSDAAKLAALIAQYSVTKGLTGTEIAQLDTSCNLESGYYVIYETANSRDDGTVATKPILLDLRSTDAEGNPVTQRNITLKDATVSLTKNIVKTGDDDTEVLTKEDTVAIGDVVNYKVETNFPVYEANVASTFTSAKFDITDTFEAALKYDSTTGVTVTVNGAEVAESEDTYSLTTSDTGIVINFKSAYLFNHQGESVVVTYSANVKSPVQPNYSEGNKNTVTVTYSNNPEVDDDVITLIDYATVYTFDFNIVKFDGADDSLLAGAKFQMKNSDGKIMYFEAEGSIYKYGGAVADVADVPEGYTAEIVTGDSYVEIYGVDEGVYTLTETEAPAGFAKLANPATITVEAIKGADNKLTGAAKITVTNAVVITDTVGDTEGDTKNTGAIGNNDVSVILRNYRGISLPETGSITSIILMIAGAVVVIGGAVYMVLSRKKGEK